MVTPVQICTGQDPATQGQAWFDYWSNDTCYNVFYDILYTTSQNTIGYNPTQLGTIQQDMLSVYQTYTSLGNTITDPGQPTYNVFQDVLHDTCARLPGTCNLFLTGSNGLCTPYTRDEIAADPALLSFCGCYAPPPPAEYNITPQCDPLCTRVGTIPQQDGSGNALQCTDTVCVIDNVAISATQSSTGGVSFDQVCSGCSSTGENTCKCIISGTNISSLESQVGLQFNQQCGSNSVCLAVNDQTQAITPVTCQTSPTPNSSGFLVPLWIIIVTILAVIVIVLVILAARS